MGSIPARRRIAIIGGGPSALFVYKRLVRSSAKFDIEIFEKGNMLGAGMPYSKAGANTEHITNVSHNEIPKMASSIIQWIKTLSENKRKEFNIDPDKYTQYKVFPRLLFGEYLAAQFALLREEGEKNGIVTRVHYNSDVTDLMDQPESGLVQVTVASGKVEEFDKVIICTGHKWPDKYEGEVPGYFASPYPPSKLRLAVNHPVAIKGSSLTAIDAIRTLARQNGRFEWNDDDKLQFIPNEDSPKFRIVLHSRSGLLPAIRFHLDEPRITSASLMSDKEVAENMKQNGGFLSLDYVFEKNFKEAFKTRDPKLYRRIKDMEIEEFVQTVMDMREGKPPFQLFKEEYVEAQKSIEQRKSVYWKEIIAELSFSINYPAKYLSAEDMLRLSKLLMPLIATVIAFVPQSSCDELFALHDAGRLEVVAVGNDSTVDPKKEGGIIYRYTNDEGKKHNISYQTYIDASGQRHFSFEDFPFKGLMMKKSVSPAYLRFKSGEEGKKLMDEGNENVSTNAHGKYFLKVPGVAINDCFQIVNEYGVANERVFIMAVPYIGGYNPDYSGLDFCEQASQFIIEKIEEDVS
ncbi:FAD/NAD(P)-binding protein [Dyadobacter sp. CY343]|uniref:FAD/NAD(P)-binding protein n=1 Tax=Dyadobacter sp. CY343 TaxID=2907299 RepID=UPI001F44F3DF|nr:FAD/NAD(P)-binding protein [Dyadobacter sp. CY343]MCE7059496.1 FAD/NAD(P)-binding protein [Dyadobacter sp. CY343]